MAFTLVTFQVAVTFFIQRTTADGISTTLMPLLRDDNNNTCVEFSSSESTPWYDKWLPVYYAKTSFNQRIELIGENIGCSNDDDGKLFIFPISTWNESSGPFKARKVCPLLESSAINGTSQENCAYQCNISDSTLALRMIRASYKTAASVWKLCEITSLFDENRACSFGPVGHRYASDISHRTSWIREGRVFPSGIRTYSTSSVIKSFRVLYGNTWYAFGYSVTSNVTTVKFQHDERINKVVVYYDGGRVLTGYAVIAGLIFETNYGEVYGVYGMPVGSKYVFTGKDLLYFHGKIGGYIDAVGVQYAKR